MGNDRPEDSASATVHTFWTGPPLSPYEQLSLKSFVAAGARVLVYSANRALRVPEGVELIDAREILSGEEHHFVFPDGDRSPALHSDLFRYAVISRFGGWYADLDMVCVGKSLPKDKVYIARETDRLVNGAIMTFPSHSPFITAAIEEAWKLLPNARPPLNKRESIGPTLITQLVREYSIDHLVKPATSAYAIGPGEIPAMFDPARRAELDEIVADSDFVHLWNEYWRRIRIPKDLGPPVGSFLDGLCERFGVAFDGDARLSAGAIAAWFEEGRFLVQVRSRLRTPFVQRNALDLLVGNPLEGQRPSAPSLLSGGLKRANAPETVRTFWAGGALGPYQLLTLRSFANRGHRVEVFTFDVEAALPSWVVRQPAGDLLPADQVLRDIPGQQGKAVHAALFRHALLHRYGGWWVDPDVVLLRAELPVAEMFVAGPDEFRAVSTAAIKFPAAHDVIADVLTQTAGYGDAVERWDEAGAPMLARCLASRGLIGQLQPPESTGPISWFDVECLFDPGQSDDLMERLQTAPFLDLHQEVWLRAGIPLDLAPPQNSYLDRLLTLHDIEWAYAARMQFGDVRRWLAHMYKCIDR